MTLSAELQRRPLVRVHLQHLSWIYLRPRGQVIQAEESFQFHVMFHGDVIGAIATFNLVGLRAHPRFHTMGSLADEEFLANVKTRALQVVEAHDFLDVRVMPSSQEPQRVPALHTVTKGF